MIPNDRPDCPFPWPNNDEILAESIETLSTVEMTAIGPGRGIVVPGYLPMGESDGPVGAAGLGWTLREALGASPVFVGEAETHAPLRAALAPFDLASASVVDLSASGDAAAREAVTLCETLRPAAIVTTE